MAKKKNNKDNEFKLKLEQHWTKNEVKTLLKELDGIASLLNMKNKEYGELMEIHVASLYTGRSINKVQSYLVSRSQNGFPGGDGGIDIITIDKESNEIHFLQTKFKKFEKDDLGKMSRAFETYFVKRSSLPNEAKNLSEYIEEYDELKINPKVKYIFIGLEVPNEQSLKANFGENYFAYTYPEFFTMALNNSFPETLKKKEFKLKFNENFGHSTDYFGIVHTEDLLKQLDEINKFAFDTLFEKNIRHHVMGNDFKSKFIETITKEPERFHLYNNGLTIVADKVVSNTNKGITITNPQVVNGQQTLRTLFNLYKEKYDLSKVSIPVRLIQEKDNAVIEKIAKYSNNQKQVKESETLSNSESFRELQKVISEFNGFLIGKSGTNDTQSSKKAMGNSKPYELNEIIRSHASYKYPSLYLGKSKSSISSVKTIYLTDKSEDSKMNQIITDKKTLKKMMNAIDSYIDIRNNVAHNIKLAKKEKNYSLMETLKNDVEKMYQFAISVYYHLKLKNLDDERITITLRKSFKFANEEINFYKSDTQAYKFLVNEGIIKE